MPRLGCTISQPQPWGSHLCSYYQSSSELQGLVNAYIQVGLEDQEGCLWILPHWLTPSAATTALQRVIPLVHDYLRMGQLELIPCADWYGLHAPLDTKQILADCSRKIAQVASRFVGLRVTGDSSWVQSPRPARPVRGIRACCKRGSGDCQCPRLMHLYRYWLDSA